MYSDELIDFVLNSAGEEFDAGDETQIPHTREAMRKFAKFHPKAILAKRNEAGEYIGWSGAIPTTRALADQFLSEAITERELFERTPVGIEPEALYLSGAVVLPEYRRQGHARALLTEQVEEFKRKNPDIFLFAWPVSEAGARLTEALSREINSKIHVKRQ